MIIDVQDRVDNLIHKIEGFLKDIKQEKEYLDREVFSISGIGLEGGR